MARNLKNLNRNSELDNFKFFSVGVRITEILMNFSLSGKFFVLLIYGKEKAPDFSSALFVRGLALAY